MLNYFPCEILEDILHRQSLKTLVLCTSICKAWKSLITDPAFILNHVDRTIEANNGIQNVLLVLLRRRVEGLHEFHSLRLDNEQLDLLSTIEYTVYDRWRMYSQVVGTCNGLVCIFDCLINYAYTFIILNPSVRTYVMLPHPSVTLKTHGEYDECFGFGFDSRNNDFKIVRLVNKISSSEVEIYSLARGCWKSFSGRVPSFMFKRMVLPGTNRLFMNGVLHWTVMRRRLNRNFILTFDVVEETFGELMLPQSLRGKNNVVYVLGVGEWLTVCHWTYPSSNTRCFNLWVMKEYGIVESWTKVFSYTSEIGILEKNISRPLGFRKSGELLLQNNRTGEIIAGDVEKELQKNLGIMGVGLASFCYHVGKITDVISF